MATKSLRREFPFSSLDPDLFLHELTRLNTDSSVVPVDSFADHTGKTIPQEHPTVWTDEKHNLYLSLLEASFVMQLSHSIGSSGWLSRNKIQGSCIFPHRSATKSGTTTERFEVRRDTYLKAMQFESDELPLDSTADSQDVLGRSSTCLSTSNGIHCLATSLDSRETVVHNGVNPRGTMNFFCESASCSEKHAVCCHNDCLCGSGTDHSVSPEVSDQNFVEQQGKTNHNTLREMPQLAIYDAPIAGQVFPFGRINLADGSDDRKASQKRGKKRLLTECPERLASPKKSEIPYFLRGS